MRLFFLPVLTFSILLQFVFSTHAWPQIQPLWPGYGEDTRRSDITVTPEKKVIGILEIQALNQDARDFELGKVFTEMLTTSFVISEAFSIIEREQLNRVLNEIKLTHTGIVDTSDVKTLGKMLGASAIVLGSITKFSQDIRLDIRIVDVETGLILMADMIIGKFDIKSISSMADTIVNKMINRLYISRAQPRQDPSLAAEPLGPTARPLDNRQAVQTDNHVWSDPYTGMEFVWVPGGCFQMGCGPWDGNCFGDETPVHDVCVDGFWIGKFEVTQGQWKRVMNSNPSRGKIGDNYPVGMVSWNMTQNLIGTLNSQSRGITFRLPTEAEWEFACRSGGQQHKYCGGKDANGVAWNNSNSGGEAQPVGKKTPNALGIHDMSGNAWEWVKDVFDPGAYSRPNRKNNPIVTSGSTSRVLRGGSWDTNTSNVRSANRVGMSPANQQVPYGFRLVAIPVQQ